MNDYVADLDAALAEDGEEIILRRVIGAANIDVKVQANVRLVSQQEELVAGTTQDDIKVIISPTQIAAAQWPGGGVDAAAPFNVARSHPKKGDKLIYQGRAYRVEQAISIKVAGQVVRIEMLTIGGAGGG